jgi:DNA-binding NarL/FixJ family response regulator
LSIVIIDDHTVFSRGLELLLNADPARLVEVRATTSNASEAAYLVERHGAKVALVDLQMPPPGGLGAVREIKKRSPETSVIALTGAEDIDSGLAALRAGVDGYIVKTADPEHLVPPILAVAAGMSVMPDWLRARLVEAIEQDVPDLSALGEEELEILTMVAQGRETAAIAKAIHVSDRTAKRMLAGVLRHVGATNRIQAAVVAARAGLVDVDDVIGLDNLD